MLSQSLLCYAIFSLYTAYWIPHQLSTIGLCQGGLQSGKYPHTNICHQVCSNRAWGSCGYLSVLQQELRGKAFKDWKSSNVLRHREKAAYRVLESGECTSKDSDLQHFSRQLLINPTGSGHYKEGWAGNQSMCDCNCYCMLFAFNLFSSNFVSFDLSATVLLCEIHKHDSPKETPLHTVMSCSAWPLEGTLHPLLVLFTVTASVCLAKMCLGKTQNLQTQVLKVRCGSIIFYISREAQKQSYWSWVSSEYPKPDVSYSLP